MSNPQENLNLIPSLEGCTSPESEILKKLQQIFGMRNHQNTAIHAQSGQEYQASFLKFMTQYYMLKNSNTVMNNHLRAQTQLGMPMMQAPLMPNIYVNNFFFNQHNSYNYPQINNQTINTNLYSQSNDELLKAVYSHAAAKIAQNHHHVYQLENNKENQNNISNQSSNLKYNEINQTQKNCQFEKKNQFVSKKRSREDEKQPTNKKIKKSVKKLTEISESADSSQSENKTDDIEIIESANASQSENKTDDSESNNKFNVRKAKPFNESIIVGFEILEEISENVGLNIDESAISEARISALDKPHDFMRNHFPKEYLNLDTSNFKDPLNKKKDISSLQYFQYPKYLENSNLSSDSSPPKKIWTSNFGDLTVLENLLLKTNLYWPLENLSFNQEIVLEFLMINKMNKEKTINLIRYKDKSFTEFVNVKKAMSAEIDQIANKNKKTYV